MNYIVLVKQVPNVADIPDDAFNRDTGVLMRGRLDSILNPLDECALNFALDVRKADDSCHNSSSKIVYLTMGPASAKSVLEYSLKVSDDMLLDNYEGVLLTDKKFGGADTCATAYSLSAGIKRIEQDFFGSDDYIIFAGMQSVDGDTAQVPPQIAEELGIDQIAYVNGFELSGGDIVFRRIGPSCIEHVKPDEYPVMVTVTKNSSQHRYCRLVRILQLKENRYAQEKGWSIKNIHSWNAEDASADENRIGLNGSRTKVYRIFPPEKAGSSLGSSRCRIIDPENLGELVGSIAAGFNEEQEIKDCTQEEPTYKLNGRQGTYRGHVWVYAEQVNGKLAPVALELVSKARELADSLDEQVDALLLGGNMGAGMSGKLIDHGADNVYIVDSPGLNPFLPMPYTDAVCHLIGEYGKPQIMLFGATPLGRELAPRVAFRASSGLTADCTGLEIKDYSIGKKEYTGILIQTRPALGGNIMASILTHNSAIQMATIRPGVMKSKIHEQKGKGRVIRCEYTPSPARTEILKIEEPEASGIDIASADIIVSAGLGLGSSGNINKYLEPLAERLSRTLGSKPMIGASRSVVDAGWMPYSSQVGQTGRTVTPRLYFAIGISGAVQHTSGMSNSHTIVAVNKDPSAQIFQVADYGIIGNLEDIIPELIKALKIPHHSDVDF